MLVALVLAGGAGLAAAEVIELTTGERITGTVKGTTRRGLVVVVKGKQRTIPRELIAGIEFETSGSSTAPPAAVEPVGPAAPPAATRRTRNVAAPRPEPDLTKVPAALREAMRAVLDLRATAASGPSREDYAARTEAAGLRVDQYVADAASGSPEVKRALASAMRFYRSAAGAWSAFDTRGDLAAVGGDPVLGECPHLRETVAHDAARWKFKASDPAFVGLMAGTEGMEDLWACASDKVNEVSDLLARQRPSASR